MTTKASDATAVHYAHGKIVALHPILVRGAVREIIEVGLAQPAGFELPVVLQVESHLEADGPIVILPFNRVLERPPLRVALDANVVRVHVVQPGRIHDVCGRIVRVRAPWAVAALAANIPLDHTIRMDVVTHGMASVAEWARRTLHVVRRVERRPPVRSVLHEVAAPDAVGDIPLRREYEIVVADPREVTLLPDAPVDQC